MVKPKNSPNDDHDKSITWINGSSFLQKPPRALKTTLEGVLTPNNGMSNPGFRKLPGTFENDNLYLDRYCEVVFQNVMPLWQRLCLPSSIVHCLQSLRDLGEVFRKLLKAFRAHFGMPCGHWRRKKVRKIKIWV